MDPPTCEIFPFDRMRISKKPLADVTGAGQVYKATVGSKAYAVKLYLPFSRESMEINRSRLKSYRLTDAQIEARFHPWRRETRVYERIDNYIRGPERHFFPTYYGSTKLKWSLCPAEWRYRQHYTDDVPVIVLELLDGTQTKALPELHISEETRQRAEELYSSGLDIEYIHIYIHCMEKIEVLHNARIVHGDIKPDIFMNCASVVLDFSISWSWEDGEPCLDPFLKRLGPTSFETRMEGERRWLQKMIVKEHDANGTELRDRVPSWRNCERCRKTMKEISDKRLEQT